MKMLSSPCASALFRAVSAGLPLAFFLPCSLVHADNTHTATVNGTAGSIPNQTINATTEFK